MNALELEHVRTATPPAEEPVTLAEMRAHLRLDGTHEDPLVEALVRAAREIVETALRRRLVATGLELSLSRFPATILLPFPPVLEAPSIAYIDSDGNTQTLTAAAADYRVDALAEPGRLLPPYAGSWPATRDEPNAVQAAYTAGLGAVVLGTDETTRYRCIADHVATAATAPTTGASHAVYWRAAGSAGAALTWAVGTLYHQTDAAALLAVKLLAAHWFEHREATSDRTIKSVPWTIQNLIWSVRTW